MAKKTKSKKTRAVSRSLTGPALTRSYRGYTGVTSWYSACSPDERFVLAGFGDCSLQLYDARTGTLARELSTSAQRQAIVSSVAFSADSRWALSGDFVKRMSLWDVSTGSELQRIASRPASRTAWPSSGRSALTGGYDKTVRLWDLPTGKELANFGSHDGYVLGLAVTTDGTRAVTGGRDRLVKVWDIARGVEVATLEGHGKRHPGSPAALRSRPRPAPDEQEVVQSALRAELARPWARGHRGRANRGDDASEVLRPGRGGPGGERGAGAGARRQ